MGHLSLDYSNPLGAKSKFEAGYALELHRQESARCDTLDLAQVAYKPDPAKTYRFKLDQAIHAVYGTYERALGKFSVLSGLREEYATLSSPLVTGAQPFSGSNSGLYPTLHLSYQARPHGRCSSATAAGPPAESDDLNPFPEYTDPYNIDFGQPAAHARIDPFLRVGIPPDRRPFLVRTHPVLSRPAQWLHAADAGGQRLDVPADDGKSRERQVGGSRAGAHDVRRSNAGRRT